MCGSGVTIASDPNIKGDWTGFNASLDRPLLKKDKFLAEEPAKPTQPESEPAPAKPATIFGELLQSALKTDGE